MIKEISYEDVARGAGAGPGLGGAAGTQAGRWNLYMLVAAGTAACVASPPWVHRLLLSEASPVTAVPLPEAPPIGVALQAATALVVLWVGRQSGRGPRQQSPTQALLLAWALWALTLRLQVPSYLSPFQVQPAPPELGGVLGSVLTPTSSAYGASLGLLVLYLWTSWRRA